MSTDSDMKVRAIAPWWTNPNSVRDYALGLLSDGTLSIDDQGRIWRHYNRTKLGRVPVTPKRAENPTRKGYLAVTLGIPGTRITRKVLAHILVWISHHGSIPDHLQINHKDLNKVNNAPDNLELMDQSGNIRHSYAHGRRKPWSEATEWRPGIQKRTVDDYARLRELRAGGMTQKAICDQEGISRTHLQRILYRKGGAQCST